jgi:hypothetical protein
MSVGFPPRKSALNTKADFSFNVIPRRVPARRLAPLRPRFFFRPARPRRAIPVRSRRTASRIDLLIPLRIWKAHS